MFQGLHTMVAEIELLMFGTYLHTLVRMRMKASNMGEELLPTLSFQVELHNRVVACWEERLHSQEEILYQP